MARPDNLESHNPHTRQGKSAGGSLRGLPNMGARKGELTKIHLNGELGPEASVKELRQHLGIIRPPEGYSRNFRNPKFRLPDQSS